MPLSWRAADGSGRAPLTRGVRRRSSGSGSGHTKPLRSMLAPPDGHRRRLKCNNNMQKFVAAKYVTMLGSVHGSQIEKSSTTAEKQNSTTGMQQDADHFDRPSRSVTFS